MIDIVVVATKHAPAAIMHSQINALLVLKMLFYKMDSAYVEMDFIRTVGTVLLALTSVRLARGQIRISAYRASLKHFYKKESVFKIVKLRDMRTKIAMSAIVCICVYV